MDTKKLASARNLPSTSFATHYDETSTGRQLLIYPRHIDDGLRIEVFQPIGSRGIVGRCLINVYEAYDLVFEDAILFYQAFSHAIIISNVWSLDSGKRLRLVLG